MVKERRPNFVFLMETICFRQYMDDIRQRLGFDNFFVVDPVGRHINVIVKDGEI
jgi:hypothetical protein